MSPGITRLLVALIVSLPLFACMPPVSKRIDQTTLPEEFAKLDRTDADILDSKAKLDALLATYGRIEPIVEAVTVDHLTDDNLEDYFRAANRLAFYSMEMKHVSQMRTALNEMVRRGHAKRSMRNDMLQAYIQARALEEAHTFADLPMNSDLDKPPAFVKEEANPPVGIRVWSISDDGKTMRPERVVVKEGLKVIVVSSPWCHFSQAAGQSISKDKQLSAGMQSHALWLMPQVRASDFSDLASWNARYPDLRMSMVDQQSDWPLIPSWATPGFYFFRDGKLIDSVVGWPGPEQASRLRMVLSELTRQAPSGAERRELRQGANTDIPSQCVRAAEGTPGHGSSSILRACRRAWSGTASRRPQFERELRSHEMNDLSEVAEARLDANGQVSFLKRRDSD